MIEVMHLKHFMQYRHWSITSDQPGRIAAVFIVSPILAHKGILYDDRVLTAFSIVLFAWDLWWLLSASPRRRPSKEAEM